MQVRNTGFLCHKDKYHTFVKSDLEEKKCLQVTAIELEGAEGQESIMYDITLCELAE